MWFSATETNTGKRVFWNVHRTLRHLRRVCSDSGQQGSHTLYKEHPAGPGFLALSEVSPGMKTTSLPALPPRVLSYLFHLTPQPVDATPLGFGDSGGSYFMDGDGGAGCGGMDRLHCRGNTHVFLETTNIHPEGGICALCLFVSTSVSPTR